MIVLDVDDELGERLELETAAPEPAGIREERGSGDARHAFGAGAFTGWRWGSGSRGGEARRRQSLRDRGGSAAERGAAEQTPGGGADRTAADAAGRRVGGTVGVGMGVGPAGWLAGGSLRHSPSTCWDLRPRSPDEDFTDDLTDDNSHIFIRKHV